MNLEELEIIQLLKQGQETGVQKLFDQYYVPMCLYATKILANYEISEDIVQELFIQIWEKKLVFNISGSLKNYLFRSVRNNAIKHLDKNKKLIFEELYPIDDIIDEEPPDQQELLQKKEQLYKEIEKLPPNMKKVFKGIIFEKKKYKEVAKELEISINTVKTQFSRALHKCRKSIDIMILILLA